MAKKSSRRRYNTSSVAASASAGTSSSSREVDLAAEYRYVIEDLKRVGIIAAVLIAALVALSFFL